MVSIARLVASVVTLALLAPGSAQAQMTKAEARCRAAILKSVSKYVKTAGKAMATCHKKRDAGQLPVGTDCNDVTIADSKGKLIKVEDRFAFTVGNGPKCGGLTNVLARYPECKSPAQDADNGFATTGIDNFIDVVVCEVALARKLMESTARQVLGLPNPALMTEEALACHLAIAGQLGKALGAFLKERGKCQVALDNAGGPFEYACGQSDPAGKINDAKQALDDAIAAECGALTLEQGDTVDSCGDTSAQMQDCVTDNVVTKIGSGMAAMVYGLSDCPRGYDVTLRAGNASMITDTEIDFGSSGIYHDQDTPDLAQLSFFLDCDSTCSNCNEVLDPKQTSGAGNCRCTADPTIRCSTIAGNDAACPSAGPCDCFFFPPQPYVGGGAPTCVLYEMNSDLVGTVNVGTGSSAGNLDLSARVYLGLTQTQPCPTCVGDPVTNDGVGAGTCNGGARNGLACDANARHCAFGDVSYECQPSLGLNISGAGLQIDYTPLTDGPVSLSTPTCGGATDSCSGSCVPDVGDDYACDSSDPPELYCDGITMCSGQGYLGCLSNADCAPISAGNCSISDTRDCPSDPLTAVGVSTSGSGPFFGDLVTTFCIPSTTNAAINAVVGLPGPGRLKYDMEYRPRCGICSLDPTEDCSTNAECTLAQGVCVPDPTLLWVPPGTCI